ncbi:MAG TPA: 3-deoxy-8-phosphooctulonate synthase [Acidobacteriota bacterium]|nr:3-deoxy-8-phosphooctulonate synthase [Acidobacteriota bacterium]
MTETRTIRLRNWSLGGGHPLFLIAGPCVIESRSHCLDLAGRLGEIAARLEIPFIFKASYDKANRTSVRSFRGPGIDEGLEILETVRRQIGVPVLSDVHSPAEADQAGRVLDVIQVPAFLCRQTDLLLAAARTGRIVNVKKGQFLAPWDAENILEKIASAGNRQILLTERGTSFGYNNLVVDFKSLPVMREYGFPVVFDATHSVQLPGGAGIQSSGQAEFIEPLARAAVAVGVDGLFCEVHENPEAALSDGANALRLDRLEGMLNQLKEIDSLVKSRFSSK